MGRDIDSSTWIEDEVPQKQFKGWWIPAHVVELFEDGTINAKELILLCIIHGLSKSKDGCFASNGYLGKLIKLSADRASKMISHLTEISLIKVLSFDGRRRRIITYWDSGPHSDAESASAKTPRQTSPKGLGRLAQNAEPIIDRNKDRNGSGAHAPHARSFLSTDFTQKGAKRLRNVLEKAGSDLVESLHIKESTLEKDFIKLVSQRGVSHERIKSVVIWFENGGYEDRHTPKMHKAGDFERNFHRYEEAMKRWKTERGEDCPQEESPHEKLIQKVRSAIMNERAAKGESVSGIKFQREIDNALASLGLSPGSLTEEDLNT